MFMLAKDLDTYCNHAHPCVAKCSRRNFRTSVKLMTTMYAMFSIKSKLNNIRTYENQDNEPKLSSQVASRRFLNMLCYSKAKQFSLTQAPLGTLLRAVCSIPDKLLVEVQELCWRLLLDANHGKVELAGALFLLCAAKKPNEVQKTISDNLNSPNPSIRDDALRKIGVLWQCRNRVWKNAEVAARREFKIPNPTFSFTLSPSALGLRNLTLCDPPWLPHIVNMDDLIAQNGSLVQNSFVLATHTLSHYREQQKKNLLQNESEERAKSRKGFYITNVPSVMRVCHEMRRKVMTEEAEDGDGVPFSSRRFSIRQPSEASCGGLEANQKENQHQTHCRSSLFARTIHCDHTSQENISKNEHVGVGGGTSGSGGGTGGSSLSSAYIASFPVFPTSVAGCISTVIDLMADTNLCARGIQVGEVAKNIMFTCMMEDTSLFLRCIVDKLTSKQGSMEMLGQLRKLINLMPSMAPQMATTLINHLIEAILRFSHSPVSDYMNAEFVSAIATILPNVSSIDLKTMKQALYKEKIELQLFITAGTPGTKKLTVWPLNDYYIPSQIEVGDRSHFDLVLREALSINGFSHDDIDWYQLIDRRSQHVLCRHCYVRDFYQFSKDSVPELVLVKKNPVEGVKIITNRVVRLKLNEISRLRVMCTAFRHRHGNVDQQLNATFILDELKKLWSFPRKAIDAEFFLFETTYNQEIRDLDVVQKFYWLDLISAVFLSLSKDYNWEKHDLKSFISVWCGAMIVHCEQAPLLTKLSSTLIDFVTHFSQSFMMHGYSLILPTMLRVYSKYYENKMSRNCLELIFRQMQRVHRKPFILELFSSSAALLSEYHLRALSNDPNDSNDDSLAPENFFRMLISLQKTNEADRLDVMRSVVAEKPLITDVMCLDGEDESSSFEHLFRLAVTVIAYQPEAPRTLEMLVVMNSILPCYFDQLQVRSIRRSTSNAESSITEMRKMSINFQSLLTAAEIFTRNFNCVLQTYTQQQVSQQQADGQQASSLLSTKSLEHDVESGDGAGDSEKPTKVRQAMDDFVAPRDVLLQLCTTFYVNALFRLRSLRGGSTEIVFNARSHIRLSEIAQSLLKLLTDEEIPFINIGLTTYVKYYLPLVDWSDQAARPALFAVLKRLDRFFVKLSKQTQLRREIDSQAIAMILTGLQDLLSRQPAVAHVPHLKTFVNICARMQIGSSFNFSSEEGIPYSPLADCRYMSPSLTPDVMKLIVLQSEAFRSENCGFQSYMLTTLSLGTFEDFLLNFIIPVCFSAATESPIFPKAVEHDAKVKWTLPIDGSDAEAIVNICFEGIKGKYKKRTTDISQLLTATNPISKRNEAITKKIILLALRVTITAFKDQLQGCWPKMANSIRDIALKTCGGSAIWNFMIFVMKYKTPLVIHLKPFVQNKFIKRNVETTEETELKYQLEEILHSRAHKPLLFSLQSKKFAYEAKQLSKELLATTVSFASPVKPSPGINRLRFGSAKQSPTRVFSRVGSFRKSNSSMSREERRNTASDKDEMLKEENEKLSRQKLLRSPTPQLRNSFRRSKNNSHRIGRLSSRSFRLNKTLTTGKYGAASSDNVNKTPASKRRSSIPNIRIEQYEEEISLKVGSTMDRKVTSIPSKKLGSISQKITAQNN